MLAAQQCLAVVLLLEVVVVAAVDLGLALVVQLHQVLGARRVLRQLARLHLTGEVLAPADL